MIWLRCAGARLIFPVVAYTLLEGGRRFMVDPLFNQVNYVAAKQMLDASTLRHEAIASNLANVETPGYKRLDIDPSFAESLQRAVVSQNTAQLTSMRPSLAVDNTAIGHGRDGNTVQLESELAQLNQNSMEHTLETRLITGTLLKLRLAITGRPL